jgi:hypothetical protein
MTHPTIRLGVAAVLAIALTGCHNPYAGGQPGPASGRPTPGNRERSDSRGRAITASAGPELGSARQAARVFARLWVNWDWRSAADQQRALARLATGTLARDLRANADSARVNASLARAKPGSRGSTAAVDLAARGPVATGIVVTREQSYTAGHPDLGGRRYRVYRIRLQYDHDRWTVTRWAPQP